MSVRCSKCGGERDRVGRYCCACHAAYMRAWRQTHEMNEGQRQRGAARTHANIYKRRGHIEQQPCCVCGDADSQMHHPDHELPLMVAWLCRPCHLKWHAFWRIVSQEIWQRWSTDQAAARRKPRRVA
jgi:hypothetical protein